MGMDIYFKFTIMQFVRTIFGVEGVIQTLAYERGGNKYWVKFQDNKLDAWFWEDELIFLDSVPAGFCIDK